MWAEYELALMHLDELRAEARADARVRQLVGPRPRGGARGWRRLLPLPRSRRVPLGAISGGAM